jgi:hypothetical protein
MVSMRPKTDLQIFILVKIGSPKVREVSQSFVKEQSRTVSNVLLLTSAPFSNVLECSY